MKNPNPDDFTGKFYQTYKEEIILVLYILFQKIEEEILPYSLCETSITSLPIIHTIKTLLENCRPIILINIKFQTKFSK